MIHQVAIKSLPQEWLWCETWCDDASKVTAKTIDLVRERRNKTVWGSGAEALNNSQSLPPSRIDFAEEVLGIW